MRKSKRADGEKLAVSSIQSQANPVRRVLVVNCDSDLLQLSTEVLIRHGYEADAAADGAAAWRELTKKRYDLLIMDYEMPKVSGIQLLQKLRAARMAVAVIVATASLPRGESARHPWVQPAAMLLMPYTVSEFLGTVQAVLRRTVEGRGQSVPPPRLPGTEAKRLSL